MLKFKKTSKRLFTDVKMKFNLVACSSVIIEGKNLAPKNSRPWQPCQAAFLNIVNRGSILERTSNI